MITLMRGVLVPILYVHFSRQYFRYTSTFSLLIRYEVTLGSSSRRRCLHLSPVSQVNITSLRRRSNSLPVEHRRFRPGLRGDSDFSRAEKASLCPLSPEGAPEPTSLHT